MKVWTHGYRPFIMGGNCNAPVGFETDQGQEIDLGNGFLGYEVVLLSGKTVVVEKQSGAIIGNSIEQVKEDIRTGDPKIMIGQILQACKEAEKVDILSQEEFCKIYQRN